MALRIEICGGIASGKTTFASLFDGAATVIYEDFQAVPFWQDFYQAPAEHAFETELCFLLQHYHQVKRALSDPAAVVICDFSFTLDLAYAHVSLNSGNLRAFMAVWDQISAHLGPPQLLIELMCSAEIELKRIEGRARAPESGITLNFLEALNKSIGSEILRAAESVPILRIDSAREDFAHEERTRKHWSRVVSSRMSELYDSNISSGTALNSAV